jgi:hypothetical protein
MTRPIRHATRLCIPLILLLVLLPCGSATAEYLGNVTFDKAIPSFLPHGEHVNVSIDYKIDAAEGRRIYVIPYTDGSPSPGYGVSGSTVHGPGTGTATAYFTILNGEQVIDHVRVRLVNPDQTEVRLELFVPVYFEYGPHGVYNIQPDRSQYSRLPHGMDLNIDFDYAVDAPGCKIYARPFNSGSLEGGYGASGSADLPPSGSYSQYFYFDNDADVTHIRFRIFALDNTTLLDEFFVPWDIHWREHGLYDIEFNHPDLASLHNSQNLVGSFTFDHAGSGDLYVWMWSIVDGDYAPGSVYQGSQPEPNNPHDITRYTRVNSGEQDLDAVRFLIGTPEEIYQSFEVPVHYHYGPHALQNFVFTPASPAIMSNGEHLEMTFDYFTDHTDDVLIFGRAAYQEEGLMGMTSAGSPHYPGPSGDGDFWMTYTSGEYLADSIRFQMVNLAQDVLFLEWFAPGRWVWGTSNVITPAPETTPLLATSLGQCYPNPFNPTTTIPVTLAREAQVKLAVYDVRGRLVRTLQDGTLPAGEHSFQFQGDGLGSGAYLCRLETPQGVMTRRMTLIK